MNLSIAPPNLQPILFDVPAIFNASCNATARNAYGMAAQEIACRTLNLNPISINGNYAICFDAEKDGTFYEIKSVRRGGKAVLYDWRMRKEKQVANLYYVFVVHSLKNARRDITKLMLEKKPKIISFLASDVHRVAFKFKLNKIKTSSSYSGYTRFGYNEGYRNVPLESLIVLLPHTTYNT